MLFLIEILLFRFLFALVFVKRDLFCTNMTNGSCSYSKVVSLKY